jgi:hypothetical protein
MLSPATWTLRAAPPDSVCASWFEARSTAAICRAIGRSLRSIDCAIWGA